ncbi:MAG: hypothetical protein ACR2M7_03195 [Bdellovibrionales bacterium]
MKKIGFILVALLSVSACDTYTVKNNLGKGIKVNGILIEPNDCYEFLDFFNLIGDYPLSITQDGKSLGGAGEVFGPANYEISAVENVTIVVGRNISIAREVDTPCDLSLE